MRYTGFIYYIVSNRRQENEVIECWIVNIVKRYTVDWIELAICYRQKMKKKVLNTIAISARVIAIITQSYVVYFE